MPYYESIYRPFTNKKVYLPKALLKKNYELNLIDYKESEIPEEFRNFSRGITKQEQMKYFIPKIMEDVSKKYYAPVKTISDEALTNRGLTPVSSSNVAGIAALNGNLIVMFNNGAMYAYKSESKQFNSMLNATSKGKYVWNHLRRTNIPYMRISGVGLKELASKHNIDLSKELGWRMLGSGNTPVFSQKELESFSSLSPNETTTPNTYDSTTLVATQAELDFIPQIRLLDSKQTVKTMITMPKIRTLVTGNTSDYYVGLIPSGILPGGTPPVSTPPINTTIRAVKPRTSKPKAPIAPQPQDKVQTIDDFVTRGILTQQEVDNMTIIEKEVINQINLNEFEYQGVKGRISQNGATVARGIKNQIDPNMKVTTIDVKGGINRQTYNIVSSQEILYGKKVGDGICSFLYPNFTEKGDRKSIDKAMTERKIFMDRVYNDINVIDEVVDFVNSRTDLTPAERTWSLKIVNDVKIKIQSLTSSQIIIYYTRRQKKSYNCNHECYLDYIRKGYIPVATPPKNSKGIMTLNRHVIAWQSSDDEIVFFDNQIYTDYEQFFYLK